MKRLDILLPDDIAAELEHIAKKMNLSMRSAVVAILAERMAIDYLPPVSNGLSRQRDGIYIHVSNKRAAVARVTGGEITHAQNWQDLERFAMLEAMSQEPSRTRELYPCPPELAEKAVFIETDK